MERFHWPCDVPDPPQHLHQGLGIGLVIDKRLSMAKLQRSNRKPGIWMDFRHLSRFFDYFKHWFRDFIGKIAFRPLLLDQPSPWFQSLPSVPGAWLVSNTARPVPLKTSMRKSSFWTFKSDHWLMNFFLGLVIFRGELQNWNLFNGIRQALGTETSWPRAHISV